MVDRLPWGQTPAVVLRRLYPGSGEVFLLVLIGVTATQLPKGMLQPPVIFGAELLMFLTPVVLFVVRFLFPDFPDWVLFNLIGIGVGTIVISHAGRLIPLHLIFVAYVGLLIYDIIGVHLTGFMAGLGGSAFKLGIPLAIVLPTSDEFSLQSFREAVIEDGLVDGANRNPATSCTVIGLGDLTIPGLLAVSATVNGVGTFTAGALVFSLPEIGSLVGAAVGLALLRRLKHDLVAGMIGLLPGTVIGYLIGGLISGVALRVAFGI